MSLETRRRAYRFGTREQIQQYLAKISRPSGPLQELQERDYIQFINYAALPPQRRKDMWGEAVHRKFLEDIQFRTYLQCLSNQGYVGWFSYLDYDEYEKLSTLYDHQMMLLPAGGKADAIRLAKAAVEQQIQEQLRLDEEKNHVYTPATFTLLSRAILNDL